AMAVALWLPLLWVRRLGRAAISHTQPIASAARASRVPPPPVTAPPATARPFVAERRPSVETAETSVQQVEATTQQAVERARELAERCARLSESGGSELRTVAQVGEALERLKGTLGQIYARL